MTRCSCVIPQATPAREAAIPCTGSFRLPTRWWSSSNATVSGAICGRMAESFPAPMRNQVGTAIRTWLDRQGSIHSDQMHLEERYKVLDRDHIEFSMTLTDPKAYTTPWAGPKQTMERMESSDGVAPGIWGKRPNGKPYEDIREDYCVYSEEHSFWINDDPTGLGNNFGDVLTGTEKK